MKVRKKNTTAQVNPRTLKKFVGQSEYGEKGGRAHAKPNEKQNLGKRKRR